MTYLCAVAVKQRTTDHAREELQKGRQGPDPGNFGSGLAAELVLDVVVGQNAKRVGEAEAAEKNAEAAARDEPRFEAAIGRFREAVFVGVVVCVGEVLPFAELAAVVGGLDLLFSG